MSSESFYLHLGTGGHFNTPNEFGPPDPRRPISRIWAKRSGSGLPGFGCVLTTSWPASRQ